MDFTSYDGLLAAIALYLKRNNLTDQIPNFVQLAEARLNRLLTKLPQQRTVYRVTPSSNIFNLPGKCNSVINVFYGPSRLEYITDQQVDPHNELHRNLQYTVIGEQFWLQSKIEPNQVLTISYFQGIETLSTQNETNWLLEIAPDAYLYASLLEAQPYLVNDNRVAIWQQMLQATIGDLTSTAKDSQISSGSLVMKAG